MTRRARKPDTTASPGGRQGPESHISASQATLYLSAAPHLRRGMYRQRPPRPVGRSFAVRALFGADGVVPMPAVDSGEVRRQCAIALWQTVLRDLAVVVAVAVSAVLEPWGTLVVFGYAIVVVAVIGRVRLFSWPAFAIIAAGLLLLFTGIYRGQRFLAIPLICLGVCFAVYLTDTLLCIRHLRKLWRRSDRGPDGLAGNGDDRKELRVGEASRAYHDDHRIIGAGTMLRPVDFDVGLGKQLDTKQPVEEFKTSELIAHIGMHVISQGVGEAQGFAHGIWSPVDVAATSKSHFTHGLPNLNVGPVVAFPVPETKKYPLLPVGVVKLNYHDRPSGEFLREIFDRSQIGHTERPYVRATISSWAGELVTSVFFSAVLEGHFLSMAIQPYVIAPIIPDLRITDRLAAQNPIVVTCKSIAMTTRQFAAAAKRMSHPRRKEPGEADPFMAGTRSLRERYSQPATDHMYHADDASRIIRMLESKIITVTMDYLRDHNIDVAEDERRTLNYVQTYTIFGSENVVNTGDHGQVNYTKGDGNNQANTSNGTKG
jgi:hypothetical protein